MHLLYISSLFLTVAIAAPPPPTADVVAATCPDWDLGGIWGKVSGKIDSNNVCVYSNIRYASPPLDKLRFKAPEYPPQKNDPPPSPNPVCFQIDESKCLAGEPFDEDAKCFPSYFGNQTEDCLFLDVYVPAHSTVSTIKDLPVVVWIYGGAYMFGSKDQYGLANLPFYSGDGPINAATYNSHGEKSIIYVTGNYRLGAFGWLAGEYMEKNGDPNAGLLDQRAMLQFVRDHISKIGGNPNQVSIWGESAGASSIMHHLAMPQNIQDPLFNRAVLQSPAYQWLWDRKVDMNKTFTEYLEGVSAHAKCKSTDMACLQSAPSSVLHHVNKQIFQKQACEGVMPLGPAVDGRTILTLAPNSFTKGQVMNLDSIIVSHVDLEVPYSNSPRGTSFIPLPIRKSPQDENAFQQFLKAIFTGSDYQSIRDSVSAKYPRAKYSDQIARAAAVITDSSFTCNTRYIIDRYIANKIPVYAMDYALLSTSNGSTHASDLLPTFYNAKTDYSKVLECLKKASSLFDKARIAVFYHYFKRSFAPAYQRLLTDHAVSGNPNQHGPGSNDEWLRAELRQCDGAPKGVQCVWNLMKPQWWFFSSPLWDNKGADTQTPSSVCGYWADVAEQVSAIYAKRPTLAVEQDVKVPLHPPTESVEFVFDGEL